MHSDIREVLISEEQLAVRVAELGARISQDYEAAEEGIVLVTVLRGAVIFAADLARAVTVPAELDFMAVSSYGNAASSSGSVRITKDLSSPIAGKHVIVVEDILDTGLTLQLLMQELQKREPASLAAAVLLRKDIPGQCDICCPYVGFACPNEFVVGYGLDYAQRYRNLPYVGALKPEIYR